MSSKTVFRMTGVDADSHSWNVLISRGLTQQLKEQLVNSSLMSQLFAPFTKPVVISDCLLTINLNKGELNDARAICLVSQILLLSSQSYKPRRSLTQIEARGYRLVTFPQSIKIFCLWKSTEIWMDSSWNHQNRAGRRFYSSLTRFEFQRLSSTFPWQH